MMEGSSADGFVAHLFSFREVEVADIRLLQLAVAGLHFRQADASHRQASYSCGCYLLDLPR
jgi:hypothetical protein